MNCNNSNSPNWTTSMQKPHQFYVKNIILKKSYPTPPPLFWCSYHSFIVPLVFKGDTIILPGQNQRVGSQNDFSMQHFDVFMSMTGMVLKAKMAGEIMMLTLLSPELCVSLDLLLLLCIAAFSLLPGMGWKLPHSPSILPRDCLGLPAPSPAAFPELSLDRWAMDTQPWDTWRAQFSPTQGKG